MQSQFDHLSETYFNNFEYDLGERELGYALSFDHDLEMFAASVGLIKTSVDAVLKDKGTSLGSVIPSPDLTRLWQTSRSTWAVLTLKPTSSSRCRSSLINVGARRSSLSKSTSS